MGWSRNGSPDALIGGVLSIGKLAAGQEGYYLGAVAHGAEDYYLEGAEVPGYWTGTGAEHLGLDGPVTDDDFVALLGGRSPTDGSPLGRPNRRIPALDLTFSAPKSVSLGWALGGSEIGGEIVAAHEEALAAALGYLEREAVFVRRGHNGTERLEGSGLVGAAFRHRSSRAGDPQLHTHVVVANATQGSDGRWSALDARHLYAHARTAGFLYQAELRAGLSARWGVAWGPVIKGSAELEAVPPVVLREFSQRRAEIEAATGPGASANAARRATVRTRRAKERAVDPSTLFADWAARAEALGFGRAEVEALCRPAPQTQDPAHVSAHASARELSVELTEHDSSFDRRQVLQALAARAETGERVETLEAHADAFLAGTAVVLLGVGRFGLRYATPELLAIEEDLLERALARRDERAGIVDDVYATLCEYPTLSDEQARMVRAITSDGGGVSVVVGAAGSGKTFALAAAHTAWSGEGYRVIGCALAARAARQLQTDSGIPSATLDALLGDLDRPDTPGLGRRTVIVADEAAMIGTRKLARLLSHAHRAGAKVVLVGDPHQLPEIDAGGAFVGLAERLGAVQLVANRRQRDPVERQALLELRNGAIDDAIDRLAERGRVTEAPSSAQAREWMVLDWYASTERGDDAIMLARRRGDVADLNRRARVVRETRGELGEQRLAAGYREFASGDRVLTLHNNRPLGLINGERGTVVSVDASKRSLRVRFDGEHEPREIPAGYLARGHVDHAYAMTIHKSQGLTCDRAYVLADEQLHAEAGYTALTRGRDENHLYVISDESEVDHHGSADTDEPIDGVRRALRASETQELATDLLARGVGRTPLRGPDVGHGVRTGPDARPELDDGIDLGW